MSMFPPALAAGKDYESIRRDDYGCRPSEAVHWRPFRQNAARIAGHGRTSVSIAVEHKGLQLRVPGLNVGDVHGRQSFGGQQGIDRVEVLF
jgi:hypothetical protein